MLRGVSRGKEVERGMGWVVLRPDFFLHDVIAGVFGSAGGGGGMEGSGAGCIVTAARVCEAVIG